MSAKMLKLEPLEMTFLHVVNFLENSYGDRVLVMDMEFRNWNTSLYGHPDDIHQFRRDLEGIMLSAMEKHMSAKDAWRTW